MLGGDDYDTIQEEIDILDASVVHKTGNLAESINGVKTFVSNLVVNNATTDITTSSTFTVRDSTNTWLSLSDTAGIIRAPNGGSTLDIQGALMRIDGSNPGGLNQLFFGAVTPFSSIEFRNTSMLFLNTDIVITTDSTNTSGKQMGISALSTTTGDLNFLLYKRTSSVNFTGTGWRWVRQNSGGDLLFQRRSTSSGGISTNTTIQSIDSGGTTETFTCATQTKVASTAFKVQTVAGTDKLNITPTAIELVNDEIIASANTGNIALLMAPTGSLVVQNNTIQKLNIGTSTTTIANTDIFFNMGDQFTVTSFNARINATSTNFLKINNVDKMVTTSTETTITNTSINATGNLYATRYFCGSSGGSSNRLASMTLPLGTCLIPTGSATPSTVTGNWSYTGTSTQMRTPEWGNFYPLYALIGFDNGTITGGGVMTIAIRIREETNNYDYSTDAFALTSATLNAPTGASSAFTTFTAGSNSRISGGVLIRAQIVLTRSLNISASSKSCYFTVYGYQST